MLLGGVIVVTAAAAATMAEVIVVTEMVYCSIKLRWQLELVHHINKMVYFSFIKDEIH